jgi:hypothetical protein
MCAMDAVEADESVNKIGKAATEAARPPGDNALRLPPDKCGCFPGFGIWLRSCSVCLTLQSVDRFLWSEDQTPCVVGLRRFWLPKGKTQTGNEMRLARKPVALN